MRSDIDVPVEALLRVRELHARIDESVARISGDLGARLRCGVGCSDCCVDGLSISAAEAARIAQALSIAGDMAPAPPGRCAMLDPQSGACRVYEARPYVCRTQGLPLRWVENDVESAAVIEHRDICPKNELPAASGEIAPLEAIPASSCWTVGRAEQALAMIDRLARQDARSRVFIRDLLAPRASSRDAVESER